MRCFLEFCAIASPKRVRPDLISSNLCAHCGFCCNGVIFADVRLQPGDDWDRLKDLLVLRAGKGASAGPPKACQPCSALDGVLCRIYNERPQHCRHFECLLFQNVAADELDLVEALSTVKSLQRLVARIRKLLAKLGDADEHLPLARRLRRVSQRLERVELDPQIVATYGELTLAAHRLNTILQAKFFPG